MKSLPVSKQSYPTLTNANSPNNSNQVSILYGLEMTKLYCVLLILISEGKKKKTIDFSSSDRKLHNKPVRERFLKFSVLPVQVMDTGHCFKNS